MADEAQGSNSTPFRRSQASACLGQGAPADAGKSHGPQMFPPALIALRQCPGQLPPLQISSKVLDVEPLRQHSTASTWSLGSRSSTGMVHLYRQDRLSCSRVMMPATSSSGSMSSAVMHPLPTSLHRCEPGLSTSVQSTVAGGIEIGSVTTMLQGQQGNSNGQRAGAHHLTMWSATTSVSGWRTVLTTCSGRTLSALITCSCTCAQCQRVCCW